MIIANNNSYLKFQIPEQMMATEADIQAPVCETRREELGESFKIPNIALTREEKTQQADTPNEHCTVEVENFLKTPSSSKVHSEVKSDASTEKPEVRADGSCMEHDEGSDKESEKLLETEISTGRTNGNESAVNNKVRDENTDLCRDESLESEKITSAVLNKDLHVMSENSNKTKSYMEEQSTNPNLHAITSDVTENKKNDEFYTQNAVLEKVESTNAVIHEIPSKKTVDEVDILENSLTIGSNEKTKEKSTNEVDSSETKFEELQEKESEKPYSPQPLAREAGYNESTVAKNEDGEATKAGPCVIETSTRSMLPEMISNIKKPEDSSNVASEDIKTSDSSYEIETSSIEEKTATAHPQDGKTDDKAVEIKEEIYENVSTIDSNEKTEENSLIQVGGPQKKNEEHLEKDIEESSLGNEDLLESDIKSDTSMNKDMNRRATNVNEHGNTSDITEVRKTDAVINIQNEVLENSSRIGSNEETEEKGTTEAEYSEFPEKESDKPSLSEPLKREASDNEFIVMHEARFDVGEKRKAEPHETETSKRSLLPEIESKLEKQEDSLNVTSEDIKTSDSGHETETSSLEVKNSTAHPQDGKTDDKTALDADEVKEEIHENVQPIVPNEEMEENSLIRVDGSQKKDENLENVSEKPSMILDRGQEIETSSSEEQSAHSQIILDQKTEDKALDAAETKDETLEVVQNILTCDSNEKTEEKSSIQVEGTQKKNKEHSENDIEKPSSIQCFIGNSCDKEINVTDDVKPEDVNSTELLETNKASILGQHTETTYIREDQFLTDNPQGTFKTKDETTDAVDANEETKDQQLDAPPIKHDTYLEKESAIPQLIEPSTKDINVESTVMHEAEISNESVRNVGSPDEDKNIDSALLKKEKFQEASEDHKTSVSHEDIERTCSIDEPSLTANPQSIMSGKTTDATETKEITHENVATEIPHEHTKKILQGQVDCSHTENDEHLEKESEILPPTEAPVEETNDNECKPHESKDIIKAELLENEKNTVTALVKEEAQEEKHANYLQATQDDTKASESTHFTDMSSTEEKILTAEPQEIPSDKKQEMTTADAAKTHELQDIETDTLDGDDKIDSLIKEDGSEDHSSKEISLGKADDNVSAVTREARFVEEQSIKADLLEQEKCEGIVVKEEVHIESLQVSDDNTKAASDLVQDREISSLEEQSLITESHGVMCEDKTNEATFIEKESQNAATITSYQDTEDNSQTQVDVSQLEQRKHFENKPLTEALASDTVGNALAGEEADMENPIDNVQVATEDTKASSSCQTIETSSIKEQIKVADPQEISSDKIEENTKGAAYTEEKTTENDATKVPNWENEDNLPKEVYGSLETSSKEGSTGTTNDDASINIHEAMFVDENLTKVELFENEKSIECTSLEKEVVIESLKEADEDIKICATFQDRETASLVDQDQIMGHKITEATKLKEETPDKKETETNITSGKNEGNSATKVDGLQGTSLTEVSDYESNIMHEHRLLDENFLKAGSVEIEKNPDGALMKEEKSTESSQVKTEDIKASAPGQDREASSKEEQSLVTNPQENMDRGREDKTVDATDLKEETSKEKASESLAEEIPSRKDLDVITDTEVYIAEDPNCKQEESSITSTSEEHIIISNEHIINVTSSASEPSEQDIDKTYTEKLPTLDNCSTTRTPTNEDPTKSLHVDAYDPNDENKAKSKQQDTLAGISEDASKPNVLNCDEERTNSNNLNDVSDSSKYVALKEVSSSNVASKKDSTPNPSQESRKETRVEAENEDAQKQDEDDLCVSAPVQDSFVEEDAEWCPEITREMQKQEEAPLPAPDEYTVKNKDCEESEVAEDAGISFLNDKKITERENEETDCEQEIKETASIPVANDVVPKSSIETSEIGHSTANLQTGETHTDDDVETKIEKDKEEEACKLIISGFNSSSPAPNITDASYKDSAKRSIAGLEAKIDDEAPVIIQAAPSATESQEVEVIKVGEASASVSECEREDYMHAKIGTEEKTDSNEVGFAPEESKAGHEVKNQVLGNVQSCGMISKAEENLETAAEIKSKTVMVEDIVEEKETAKTNISSQKINEEGDVKNDHIDSCKNIAETHLDRLAKQEEKANTGEIFEVIKKANETEKVSEVSEEADDNAVEEPQEYLDNNREDKTIDATDLKAETFKEKAPNSVVVEIPSTKDSDVNTEHVIVSKEHVTNVTSSVSEPSKQDIDKIDAEMITVIDDGSTKIPTNEDLVETGPTESSVKPDGQVPDEEINKEESKQQDIAVGISEDVSKSNLGDISTPNPSLKSADENEEAKKQDEDSLCVSAPVQDSSTEKTEKGVKLCPASAIDSEINQEMQKMEEATEGFLNDEKHTEREHEETECKQEKALLDETVEETKEPASVVTVTDDVVPKTFTDHSTAERQLTINKGDSSTLDNEKEEIKLDKDKEDGAGEPKISDFSSPAPGIIEASDNGESKIGYEAQDIIQTAPSATETRDVENINVGGIRASISQPERDGKQPNEFGFSPEESKTGYDVRNQGLDIVQSSGVISKVEENLEAEIKSETVKVVDIIESKEIKEENEYVKNDHLGSCEEEAITESHLEDQPKHEETTNSEETFEVIEKAKVSKVFKEADGKAVEEKLQTNESTDRSLHQKGQGNSIDDVTTILATEKVCELDHSYIITGTQDSKEEVNRSSVKFRKDEDKSKDVIENEIAKEEGLQNQISNSSMKDSVSKEQPKRSDEYIIYEAPPAQTVLKIIKDGEDKKVNADTIMIQHQEEDKISKHESDPLEKQEQNDEICRSDELQTKDEVNLMHSAEKDEEEAKKEGTLSKPTEDEDEIPYTEAGKLEVPSYTVDTAQSDKKQEGQIAKCSDIEITEKDLPAECSGLGADHTKNINPENSVGNEKIKAKECELPSFSVLEKEEATCEGEVKTSQETATSTSQTDKTDVAEHGDMETGEEKDELSEERQLELYSESPVMVDIGDADTKVAHKKSHNILSGVGSKVKHSIAKVKKAITGKSSHPKSPATIIQSHLPPSPK